MTHVPRNFPVALGLIFLFTVSASDDASLKKVLKFIDDHESELVSNLKEALAIKSVSSTKTTPDGLGECKRMGVHISKKLEGLGFHTELRDIGEPLKMDDGSMDKLPPVLLASSPNQSKEKKTILIYGHLDVQPAKMTDGWDSEPFTLTERNGNLYGRGTTDDKGPTIAWLNTLYAFNQTGVELPVNLKFIFESLEEDGAAGIVPLVKSEANEFLAGVDAVVVSDSYWLGTTTPELAYATRGLTYFYVEVDGGAKDLHSGAFGGTVHEPMWDLMFLMSQLVDVEGNILIPGVLDDVELPTKEEEDQMKEADFTSEEFRKNAGVHELRFSDKLKTLSYNWVRPSLSIHGIEGAFSDKGTKTVIPGKVIGKFSIRLVPHQKPEKIRDAVYKYLNGKWNERKSTHNKFQVRMAEGAERAWKDDYNHWNYQKASKAIESVWGMKPLLSREGVSIPILVVFQDVIKKNVMLLPLGQADDGAHSQNEKMRKENFIKGSKVFATYFMELGKKE